MARHMSERIDGWLEEFLAKAHPGEQLPTDRSLAAAFGVCEYTVRKLMSRFAKSGRVQRIRGKGTFVPGPSVRIEQASPPQPSAERVADSIALLIHDGRLRKGDRMPPLKSIYHQYRIAPRTACKAYDLLEKRGLVLRLGRRLWVGGRLSLTYQRPEKEVYLFIHDTKNFGEVFRNDALASAYIKFERELAANGFVLRFEPCSSLENFVIKWRSRRKPVYGVVLFGMDEKLVGPRHQNTDSCRLEGRRLSHVASRRSNIVVRKRFNRFRANAGTLPYGARTSRGTFLLQ